MPFDFNTLSVPSTQQPEPAKPDMANVTIRVDADAIMLCDGEYIDGLQLKAGVIAKTQLPVGQHLLEFISEKFTDIKVEKVVEWPEAGKNYLEIISDLKASVDKRVAQLEQQRLAEEAERKRKEEEAARKKAEEEAERKRKAEEAERKRQAEEAERKRKAEEAERKRKAEEAERKRKEEEAARKKAEEEAERKRKAEEAERKRQAEEAERKRKAEEAARKKAEEERIQKMTPKQKFEEGKKLLKQDYDWGLEVIKMASKEGLAEASKFLAFGFADGDNGIEEEEDLALDYFLAFLKQADKDDKDIAKVNYKLGYSYQYGSNGAPEDFKKAVKYYEQATKLRDVESLRNLAFGYDFGQGCFPKDGEKALQYYLKFVDKGDETYDDYEKALYNLGVIHKEGLYGAEKDQKKAISYYKKSAELGYKKAKDRIKEIEEEEKKRLQEIANREREEAEQKELRRKRIRRWSIFSLVYFFIAIYDIVVLQDGGIAFCYGLIYLCFYWANHFRFKEDKYKAKRVSYLVPLLPVTMTTLACMNEEGFDLSSTWGWLVFFVFSLIIIFYKAIMYGEFFGKLADGMGAAGDMLSKYTSDKEQGMYHLQKANELSGDEAKREREKAIYHLEKAAEQGDDEAKVLLVNLKFLGKN